MEKATTKSDIKSTASRLLVNVALLAIYFSDSICQYELYWSDDVQYVYYVSAASTGRQILVQMCCTRWSQWFRWRFIVPLGRSSVIRPLWGFSVESCHRNLSFSDLLKSVSVSCSSDSCKLTIHHCALTSGHKQHQWSVSGTRQWVMARKLWTTFSARSDRLPLLIWMSRNMDPGVWIRKWLLLWLHIKPSEMELWLNWIYWWVQREGLVWWSILLNALNVMIKQCGWCCYDMMPPRYLPRVVN